MSCTEKYPTEQIIKTNGIDEQAKFLSENVPGLSQRQAKDILEAGFKRDSSVVIGGSRVRGDYHANSDLDVGFGSLTTSQAGKIPKKMNEKNQSGYLKLEDEITITTGNKTTNVKEIKSPEEFFQRSGIRSEPDPLKNGKPYKPSGSITVNPDGSIRVLPPGGTP